MHDIKILIVAATAQEPGTGTNLRPDLATFSEDYTLEDESLISNTKENLPPAVLSI